MIDGGGWVRMADLQGLPFGAPSIHGDVAEIDIEISEVQEDPLLWSDLIHPEDRPQFDIMVYTG